MTVIDMPRNMLINFPQLVNDANVIVLVTEMTLASARDSIRMLSWIKANAPHAQVFVVANKVQTGIVEISKADFEASIESKIAFSIPYDIKAAANAAKLGQTFADANRASKAGAAMRELAKLVLGSGDLDEAGEAARQSKKSLLGKLDLKAMLPKKGKAAVGSEATVAAN
jgi:pilus assembly protein CpaE